MFILLYILLTSVNTRLRFESPFSLFLLLFINSIMYSNNAYRALYSRRLFLSSSLSSHWLNTVITDYLYFADSKPSQLNNPQRSSICNLRILSRRCALFFPIYFSIYFSSCDIFFLGIFLMSEQTLTWPLYGILRRECSWR